MLNVYLAGPFFRPEQRDVIREAKTLLQINGCHVFDPEAESAGIWRGRAPHDCSSDDRRAVLAMNERGIKGSDLVVAWLRGTGGDFTDQGVVWEMGFASAKGIPVLGFYVPLRGENVDSLNLMLSESLAGLAQLYELGEAVMLYERDGCDAVSLFAHYPVLPSEVI